jgi:hypothetical protein
MDSARATEFEGATAMQWQGRHDGNATATEGTMGMEGATAMGGALVMKNGANWGDIIAEAV